MYLSRKFCLHVLLLRFSTHTIQYHQPCNLFKSTDGSFIYSYILRDPRRAKARMERKEDESIAENGKVAIPKDGSICGFDSLHRLLQSNLSPHLFQVKISQDFLMFCIICSSFARGESWVMYLMPYEALISDP